MSLKSVYQAKISPAVAVAAVLVFTGLLSATLAIWAERYLFVTVTIVFGVLVSLLESRFGRGRHVTMAVGLVFGFLVGLSHFQAHLSSLHHWRGLSVDVSLAFFFMVVGAVAGSGGHLARLVRDRQRRAWASAIDETEKDHYSRAMSTLVTINLIVLAAVMVLTVAGLLRDDPVELFLTTGLVALVALVAVTLAHRRFFAWLVAFVTGYFIATGIVALFPASVAVRREFSASLGSALYFLAFGAVIGLLAAMAVHLHSAFHKYWPAPPPAGGGETVRKRPVLLTALHHLNCLLIGWRHEHAGGKGTSAAPGETPAGKDAAPPQSN